MEAIGAREPAAGTIERWCLDLVRTRDLGRKLAPPPPPDARRDAAWEPAPPVRRIDAPGRPAELTLEGRSRPAPRPGALADPGARARLLHVFAHHELQAAELFARAVLVFPRTPRAFRAGLVRLCREELAHLSLYRARLEALGARFGDFPVRDWFWERVAPCEGPAAFVALLGVGLEGGNLEHCARFAGAFRAAGDEASARVIERVGREEARHVAFAVCWLERFTGTAPLDYARWRALLPAPLSPAVLRGTPLNRAARRSAGMSERFLAALAAEPSTAERRDA